MCEKHLYTIPHSNGSVELRTVVHQCSRAHARGGQSCSDPKMFEHPQGERPSRYLSPHYADHLPPSPPLSDSYSGASDGERSRRTGLYLNGEKVLNFNRRPSRRESQRPHVVIVDPPSVPPSPSPPRYRTSSATSPPYNAYDSRPRQYPYTRPEVIVEVNDRRPRPRPLHRSHTNRVPGSHDSRTSDTISEQDRRVERNLREAQENMARQQRELQNKIDRQNERINNRPALPPSPRADHAQPYVRPSVAVRRPEEELTNAMRQMRLDSEERRRRERHAQELRELQEDYAQERRLRARMMPTPSMQRSNTIGGGRRYSRIYYDDGIYRSQF